jgi:hypothetical protein
MDKPAPRFRFVPGYRDTPKRLGIDDDGSAVRMVRAPALDAFYVDDNLVTFEEYAARYHAATGVTVTRDAGGELVATWPVG